MKKLPRVISAILVIFLITACGPVMPVLTSTPTPVPTIIPSPTQVPDAQLYLSEALDIIQNNALNSKKVDWTQTRALALKMEKDAIIPSETYDTIRYVLGQLEDHHSFFLTPEDANQMNTSSVEDYPQPEGKLIEEQIGYVAVHEFGAQIEEEMNRFADQIQNIIMELEQQSVCGWIVDLRENGGGNMYPMIAGLGTLIGEGELGAFSDANGQLSTWSYHDGQSWEGETPVTKISHPDFLLDAAESPVAVLIGPHTASSGEATALSFRGRDNTRFFGQASAGLTTGNEYFPLSDGAAIVLTMVVEVDRTGKEYGGSIDPDVVTLNPIREATDWLLTQPFCVK